MQLIALLMAITAAGQPPPLDEPPPLEPGQNSYAIRLMNGDEIYVRGRTTDYVEREGRGNFWPDYPDAEVSGKLPYEFTKIWQVEPEDREERWKRDVEEWRKEHDYVRTRFADRSLGWVKQDDAAWSDRARAAALKVIQDREAKDAANIEVPITAAAEPEVEETEAPGLIELWGPQAAVGLLALVLMGVVARSLILPSDGGGWQNIG